MLYIDSTPSFNTSLQPLESLVLIIAFYPLEDPGRRICLEKQPLTDGETQDQSQQTTPPPSSAFGIGLTSPFIDRKDVFSVSWIKKAPKRSR